MPQGLPDSFEPVSEDKDSGLPSSFQAISEAAQEPLAKPTPQLSEAMKSYQAENPITGGIGNFGMDVLSSMTSPLSLGLMLTGAGETAAAKAGLEKVANLMRIPSKIAANAMVLHGGSKVISPESDTASRVGGGLEAGLGILGLRSGVRKINPKVELIEAESPSLSPSVPSLAAKDIELPPTKPGFGNPIKDGESVRDYLDRIAKIKLPETKGAGTTPFTPEEISNAFKNRKLSLNISGAKLPEEVIPELNARENAGTITEDELTQARTLTQPPTPPPGEPPIKGVRRYEDLPPWFRKSLDVMNASKAIKASYDLSAPLRQGEMLADRPEYWKAFGRMIRDRGNQAAYDASQIKILANPEYKLGRSVGLGITDLHGSLSSREESFMSTIAEKVPGVKVSERAYTQFLDELRQDTFSSLVKRARLAGLDPDKDLVLAKKIADYVNNATGRGSLGMLEKNAVELNGLLFSPRFIASRLHMLNPNNYIRIGIDSSPAEAAFMRKQYLRSALALGGAAVTTSILGKMAGGTISNDITNPDFLKSKIGDTRLDPFTGEQQYLVALAQFLSGSKESSTSGRTQTFGTFGAPTRGSNLAQFGVNKLAPIPKLAADWALATKRQGFDVTKETVDLFTPMLMQDIYDIYKSDPDLLPAGVLAGFGMGVQTYGPGTKQTNPLIDAGKVLLGQ